MDTDMGTRTRTHRFPKKVSVYLYPRVLTTGYPIHLQVICGYDTGLKLPIPTDTCRLWITQTREYWQVLQ
jgi:hypothetical protein